MPLKKRCSISAMQDNIREMIRRGYDRKQAVAAAYDTLRKACLSAKMAERAKRERWTPKEIVGEALEYGIEGLDGILEALKGQLGLSNVRLFEQEEDTEEDRLCFTEPLLNIASIADDIKRLASDMAMKCDAGIDITGLQKRLGEFIYEMILSADVARIDLNKLVRLIKQM